LAARTSLWDLENFLDKTAVTGNTGKILKLKKNEGHRMEIV
jgi:hypothetical protein